MLVEVWRVLIEVGNLVMVVGLLFEVEVRLTVSWNMIFKVTLVVV